MRKIGIIIIGVGLLFTLITGFKFVTREKVVEIGNLNISRNKSHPIAWSPLLGVAIMTLGSTFFILGIKKR
ncbi:hypothetical protein [Perlabentimonas gracilis]|uniref:hypothetical protein n=1 Tax=Perlabentimonas gracilis TaxID=2715279 RepID=UPI00140AE072|nr:hypothetical protein [Perlabentimonas gracilis]NHB68837.1 hypothetical protein [Perlabentimonas gracilis]